MYRYLYAHVVKYEHLSGVTRRWTCCRRHKHVVEEANILSKRRTYETDKETKRERERERENDNKNNNKYIEKVRANTPPHTTHAEVI